MRAGEADASAVRDGGGTRPWIVDDELWALIEPLLPPWPEGPRGRGRCRTGSVCRASCSSATTTWPGNCCPAGAGFGSGQTCRRRLDRWSSTPSSRRCTDRWRCPLNAGQFTLSSTRVPPCRSRSSPPTRSMTPIPWPSTSQRSPPTPCPSKKQSGSATACALCRVMAQSRRRQPGRRRSAGCSAPAVRRPRR
ncbi:transposase [Streptomyces atroolivaceus]|uniref:transposase n=1 Tax=Streptomyces atroolivaceus TaxID=66869 RepID=UPI003638817B